MSLFFKKYFAVQLCQLPLGAIAMDIMLADVYLSACVTKHGWSNLQSEDIYEGLKQAMGMLYYQVHSIPIESINTHLLQRGGPNALSLVRYSKIQIQNMGSRRGKTCMEYIYNGLNFLSKGMSWDMQWTLGFINLTSSVWCDVTDVVMHMDYNANNAAV
ncbi:hypothetical protein ACHAW6_012982 [Cyclotella cf. meneghiniana]